MSGARNTQTGSPETGKEARKGELGFSAFYFWPEGEPRR